MIWMKSCGERMDGAGFPMVGKSAAVISKVWNFCGFCAFLRPKFFQGLEYMEAAGALNET
jgi:hypothetical protein